MQAKSRIERDTMGEMEVAAEALWGAQTERSRRNFTISGERMPMALIRALTQVKLACASAHLELGLLDAPKVRAISAAAEEVLSGLHDGQFPLLVWQTGSGTQTNMNVNEVLANRASELLGGARGEERLVHPNDEVNKGQSTNDAFPTAIHVAAVVAIATSLLPALRALRETLSKKAADFSAIVKIGRTHLQDATPVTLGQELSGYVSMLEHAQAHLESALPHLRQLPLGGTAVGTGLNAHPRMAELAVAELSRMTDQAFVSAPNKFEALGARDALVHAHGALRGLAASLIKIANDIRWLASGPRCGLGELRIPENEPGSSIMPGKVNPTQCEAMTMACYQVMGNDVAMGYGGAMGSFELNANMPLMANAMLQSVRLLADAMRGFDEHCARGIEPDRMKIAANLHGSLMLVTALAPHIGYDKAAKIARHAHLNGLTLKEAAVALGFVTEEQFGSWVKPEKMV